jgi:HlyD family secretion protein
VEVATATENHFETTIDEDAKTRLRERFVVSAPLTGRLQRITLREGDQVNSQTVIATLAPVLSSLIDERSLREQRARIQVAQANMQRTLARMERAKVALAQAEHEVQRTKPLSQRGFVSVTKLDVDQLAVQASQQEVHVATQEHHMAAHELALAHAAISATTELAAPPDLSLRVRPREGRFAVHSPVNGRVLRILQPSEATVTAGTPLVEVGDTGQMEIVTELLTADALEARPGSPVRIERWGGEGSLQGQVRCTEPAAFTKVSALGVEEQRVKVLIDIKSPVARWQQLGDGFRVGVRIITLAQPQALTVPVSAVFALSPNEAGRAGDEFAVFAVESGRAHLRKVQLGGRNGKDVWVRSGLGAGATVVVYPAAQVKEGVRVKVRKV